MQPLLTTRSSNLSGKRLSTESKNGSIESPHQHPIIGQRLVFRIVGGEHAQAVDRYLERRNTLAYVSPAVGGSQFYQKFYRTL